MFDHITRADDAGNARDGHTTQACVGGSAVETDTSRMTSNADEGTSSNLDILATAAEAERGRDLLSRVYDINGNPTNYNDFRPRLATQKLHRIDNETSPQPKAMPQSEEEPDASTSPKAPNLDNPRFEVEDAGRTLSLPSWRTVLPDTPQLITRPTDQLPHLPPPHHYIPSSNIADGSINCPFASTTTHTWHAIPPARNPIDLTTALSYPGTFRIALPTPTQSVHIMCGNGCGRRYVCLPTGLGGLGLARGDGRERDEVLLRAGIIGGGGEGVKWARRERATQVTQKSWEAEERVRDEMEYWRWRHVEGWEGR